MHTKNSGLILLAVFIAIALIGFWFGASWYKAMTAPIAGGEGAHCGGFIKDAPTCALGYHCVLKVSMPDVGGTCVKD